MSLAHILNSKKFRFSAVFGLFLMFANVQTPLKAQTESSHSPVTDTILNVAETNAAAENAGQENNHGEEEKFDPTKVIMDHIADSHSWHLWGHTSIGLPVILYTDKGIEFFLHQSFITAKHLIRGNIIPTD